MKKRKRMFVLTETILAVLLLVVATAMLRERKAGEKPHISVILRDSDSSSWAAFKYGVKAAAQDMRMEAVVIGTEVHLGAAEEQKLMEREIENGADALIIQPVPNLSKEGILKINKKVPVMFTELSAQIEGETIPVTRADDYEMGRQLAKELILDYNGCLEGKTIGITAETFLSETVKERERGFREGLEGQGASILWSVEENGADLNSELLEKQEHVDLIVALDNGSLLVAGRESHDSDLHGALVYGIGNSTEAVCYLDLGKVECLVVPDRFYAGYQSLMEISKRLENRFYDMKSQTVTYTTLRRESLFDKENQELLFTMNQ